MHTRHSVLIQAVVDTVADARLHVSVFEGYEKEMASMTAANYASLKALGIQIKGRQYKTQYSHYTYENMGMHTGLCWFIGGRVRVLGRERCWRTLKRGRGT